MLEYDSGMIGLPLRLLAREVYDRVAREAGPSEVALITGEERLVPHQPRYWVCTTEAMPTQMDVDFVAVDEIQLAAHPTRGHVFTERLLRARGRFETWFLGAATMRRLMEELVPSARFQSATRLSKLSFTGARSLGQIPGRSAVVAFSVPQVYELAERLRVRKGGVAVVLGALSPKTRNAQVGMYQAGEVDHVVATDAIGMGLNMSISHVALASLHKFDGRNQRTLSAAELAQISGRAGRSIHDGTFGTVEPTWLDPTVAHEIENHLFPQLKQVVWRNSDLDYTSLEALLVSLQAPPPHGRLRLVSHAPDSAALGEIVSRPEAKPFIRSEEAVRLLWDVCQIPDYRQLSPDLHADLLFTIFEQVAKNGGHLDDDWMRERLSNLNRTTGDIDTLVARIAFVRTWTYVSQRHHWVKNAGYWQEQTRALEDALSDALHDRLIARFVSRRRASSSAKPASPRARNATPKRDDVPVHGEDEHDTHHPFAALLQLRAQLVPKSTSTTTSTEPYTWELGTTGELLRSGTSVARLVAGLAVDRPGLQIVTSDSGNARMALHQEAQRALKLHLAALTVGLEEEPGDSAAARGVLYQLRSGLGAVDKRSIAPLLDEMTPREVERLARAGVVFGRLSVYVRRLLKPRALEQRLALTRTFFGSETLPSLDGLGNVSLPPRASSREAAVALCLGYVSTRQMWIRCDIAERVVQRSEGDVSGAISSLGCKKEIALRVIDELRQRGGLPSLPEFVQSRNASSSGAKPRRSGFRRQRHSKKVKHVQESTATSQK